MQIVASFHPLRMKRRGNSEAEMERRVKMKMEVGKNGEVGRERMRGDSDGIENIGLCLNYR
jgi:hypothetical protein